MSARIAHMHMMLNMLARGEEPYTGGRFGADHIKVYADDAQVLVDVIDELMRLRGELAEKGERGEELKRLRASDQQLTDDVVKLTAENERLRAELEIRRATVTTGGPAPAFTSRPYYEGDPVQQVQLPEVVKLPECGCLIEHAPACPHWKLPL